MNVLNRTLVTREDGTSYNTYYIEDYYSGSIDLFLGPSVDLTELDLSGADIEQGRSKRG